jgi:LmbE family N-acetylglucosaminyl deacetylase
MKMMKKTNTFLILMSIMMITALCACNSREEISQFAPVEIYPNDTLLQSIADKRAMIVIAHDDDMCAMSGTMSLLNKAGWEIAVVSISKTAERNAAQVEACKYILDTVMFAELSAGQIRNDSEEERESYFAFPKDSFDLIFNKPVIEEEFVRHINSFNPVVIFTLDSDIGGYGHPEHVLISQMVIDLSEQQRITPLYIYQSVFTDHMESTIMRRHSERMKSWGFPGDEWEVAKKIYMVEGMPEPTVQINITSEAQLKMDYLRSYNKREREVLGFFIPEFEEYTAEEYFTVFDREFFRVISVGDQNVKDQN